MKRIPAIIFTLVLILVLGGEAALAGVEVSDADQQALKTQYVGKVLLFRKPVRMASSLEFDVDGSLKGKNNPGYWAVDGALQVKDLDFRKDRVTFKCTKLWADIRDDGRLHFFPASAALKGKAGYPASITVTFRTGEDPVLADAVKQRLQKVFLGEQESVLSFAPQPIAAYIQKITPDLDVDPVSGGGFAGTPPQAVNRPAPDLPREAEIVGQSGRESFIVFVDEQGNAALTGFTHLLQYGIEEATIEAVRGWKFTPAVKDGKPVAVHIPMSIDYKPANK